MPQLVLKKLIKPREGDLRELVLPGGGDLCLRMWSGIRRYVGAIAGWHRTRRDKHSTYGHHIKFINVFLDNDTQHAQHAWKMLDEKENLRIQCELLFFLGVVDPIFEATSDGTEERNETGIDLLKALDECVDKA